MARILIVDDEPGMQKNMSRALQIDNHSVHTAGNVDEALKVMSETTCDVVVSDILMPGRKGTDLIQIISGSYPAIKVILLTGAPTIDNASLAVRFGAFDYLVKPVSIDQLRKTVKNALHVKKLEDENRKYSEGLEELVTVRTGELVKSEKRYKDLIENALAGLFVQSDSKLLYTNSRMAEMLGYDEQQMQEKIGESFIDIIHPAYREVVKNRSAKRAAGDNVTDRYEVKLLKKDGSSIWVEIYCTLTEWNNQPSIIGHIINISDKKKAEAEKEKLELQLLHSQKMEAIGRLAGGISHDFNNLLTGITGNVTIAMREMDDDDPTVEMLKDVQLAAKKAADLTKQLLAFSKKQINDPRVININDVIRGLTRMLKRIIGESVDLELILAKDPGLIKADPVQMEQVLVNLVINAKDAMNQNGKITISSFICDFKKEKSSKSLHLNDGLYSVLSVSDTGHGIDEKTMRKIFEPFFTTKSKDKGTGLGLSTVYGIVKQHGGDIEVISDIEQQTEFNVYLPIIEATLTNTEARPSTEEFKGGTETVLVVEDDPILGNMVIRILKKLGYNTLKVDNAEDALDIAKGSKPNIDLVLTDVVLPGMNGQEMMKEFIKYYAGIKVIFTSGYLDSEIFDHKDLEHFLPKPFTPESLALIIRKVLDSTILH